MAYWTILGKPNAGGNTFGVTLDTDNKTWIAGGVGVDVFKTKKGPFEFRAAPARETVLLSDTGKVVANFRDLHKNSDVGDTGVGYQQETATDFKWNLQSI